MAETMERLTVDDWVVFEVRGRIYGGCVTEVSPGGYGTVIGYGFKAEGVPPSICRRNTLLGKGASPVRA